MARVKDIHLVATHRTDLCLPQITCLRIDGEPVAIAVSVSKDLRLGTGLADERIIGRSRAVVAQPERLAHVVVQCLRLHSQAVVFGPGAAQPVAVTDGHR